MTGLPDFFRHHAHDALVSTNDEARRLAEAGAPEGTLVTARRQSGGRGRRGRDWHSPEGNLYASFLLLPKCPPMEAALLSFVAALAVIGALDRWLDAADAQLIWPNDVHVGGAKISGILLETVPRGEEMALVVGIGINIRHHPDLVERRTTSLHALGKSGATPDTVLVDMASGLLLWYERWRREGFAPIREAWLARARGVGQPIVARFGGAEIPGVFGDLDGTGALVLIPPCGAPRRITAGEVHFEEARGPMLLAINANNTNTKFSVYDGERAVGEWRQRTSAHRTGDEHAVWLHQLMAMEGIEPASIDGAIIATAVPQALFNIRRLCTRYLNCEPIVIGEEGCELGIEVRATPPVGADRIANTVGAGVLFPKQAMIVVDFGTATTFDVVDEAGNYRGGVIAPGVNLSLEALHNATALLPRVVVEKPDQVIGTNTVDCMHSGVFWGYVGLIEGIVSRVKVEFGEPMGVVSTGGLAPLFEGVTEVFEHVAADITMRGLVEIYRRSTHD